VSAGNNPQGPAPSVIMGLLCLAGGGLLIFFGSQYLKRKKTVTEFALQMLRADDKIVAGQLAQRLGLSEVHVRGYIAESQRKGIIPFKADVV
jgi:hypothetical protein